MFAFLNAGQLHQKSERAIRLLYPPLYCKLASSSNTTNKNLLGLRSGDSNISLSVTVQNQIHIHMKVLSHNYHCYYVLDYLHFLLNYSVYY